MLQRWAAAAATLLALEIPSMEWNWVQSSSLVVPRATAGGLVGGWLGFLCKDKPKPLVEAWTPVASTGDVCLCSSLCVYEDVERKCVHSVPVVKQKVCSCQSYFLLGSLSDALFLNLADLWIVANHQRQLFRCNANFILVFLSLKGTEIYVHISLYFTLEGRGN